MLYHNSVTSGGGVPVILHNSVALDPLSNVALGDILFTTKLMGYLHDGSGIEIEDMISGDNDYYNRQLKAFCLERGKERRSGAPRLYISEISVFDNSIEQAEVSKSCIYRESRPRVIHR